MDDSSFFSNSSKFRKRKPIFAKDEHSPVTKLENHLSRCTSQQALPNRNSPPSIPTTFTPILTNTQQANAHIIRVNAPASNAVRVSYSQPKVAANPPHITYTTRPATPIIPPQHYNTQPIIQSSQFAPQQTFYQTMPAASSIRRTSHHLYQTQPITMAKVQRRSRVQANENVREQSGAVTLRPTVVAIERVMKQIGSNHIQKQVTYLSKEEGECEPTIYVTPPSSSFSPSSSSAKVAASSVPSFTPQLPLSRLVACSEQVQMSKLSEINSLLTQNYNLLYNQFFNLKREIREEEVVQEQAFMQRSLNQIEAIFSLQTNQALAQMEEVYRSTKNPLKKGFRPRNEIKMKNLYA